jgi:hypothetical protein
MRLAAACLALAALAATVSCTRIPSAYEPNGVSRHPMEYPNKFALAPFVRMNDPRAPLYLREGVGADIGAGTWRWAARRAVLDFPLGDADRYRFAAEITVPPFSFEQTGPVNIAFSINGHPLDSIRFDAAAQKRFEHDVPDRWLKRDSSNLVTIEADKAAHEKEVERGFIITAVGFVR